MVKLNYLTLGELNVEYPFKEWKISYAFCFKECNLVLEKHEGKQIMKTATFPHIFLYNTSNRNQITTHKMFLHSF